MSVEALDKRFWRSLTVPDSLSSFLLSYTVYLNVAAGQDFTGIKHWTATGRRLSSLLLCLVAEQRLHIKSKFYFNPSSHFETIVDHTDDFFTLFHQIRQIPHRYLSRKHISRKKKNHIKKTHLLPNLSRATNNFQSVRRWKPDQNLKYTRSPQSSTNLPQRSSFILNHYKTYCGVNYTSLWKFATNVQPSKCQRSLFSA